LRSLYGKSCLRKWGFVNVEELKEISKRLLRIEQGTQIQLTDEQIEELPYILDIIMNRVRCHPQPWSCNIDKYDIRNTVQFPIIKRYFQDFAFLKDSDILYLSLHILSSNRIESAMDFLNSEEIVKATDQFVQSIKNKLVIHFMKETEFKEKLLLHVQPAIFRNLFGFHIHNPLTAHFKNEHREIFRTVADAAKSFANIVGHPLPDEEIAYLSMIVLGWLYQSAENQTSNLKAVVLCPNGTSISILLLENLKWMFPEIEFIGAFSFRQYREKPKDVDFIFTTKPIKSKARVIVVPPFLEPESRRQLHDTVAKLLQTDASIKAKEAVKVIKDLLPQSKRYTAEMMLKLFFAKNQTVPPKETNQTNKLKIGRHNIMIVGDPVKWKDCLDVVFAPMLLRKTADQNYLDRCKDVFFKNYRQMLIGPMIYLPHTTASDNLNEPDIEIVLFRKSIVDPDGNHVQLMVGLVPAKNNEHVPLLLLLNHLFIQQQTKQSIVQAADKQKILQIISEKGNKMDKMNFLAPC
jgi:transcriptional antiterminator/mannitol/fructose-specific phosphotransferase system IIA component (Ntr-type)